METVIGKKMKFRARDPLSALTHFIGFLAVIPPVICLLERSETTAQVISFAIFGISLLFAIWCKHNLSYPVPCSRKKLRF